MANSTGGEIDVANLQAQQSVGTQASDPLPTEVTNKVIVTVARRDVFLDQLALGVNMESSEQDILRAVQPIIRENEGADIADDDGDFSYAVRKSSNSNNIHVYPKPVAGY
ncbi:MAG: hypothetical protein WC375_05600 [Methanomassiliicoccales archaeon]|jgi:hypothetical protein